MPHDGQFHGIDTEGVFPARRDLLDAANVSLIYSCAPLEAPSLTLVSQVDEIYTYRNDAARAARVLDLRRPDDDEGRGNSADPALALRP